MEPNFNYLLRLVEGKLKKCIYEESNSIIKGIDVDQLDKLSKQEIKGMIDSLSKDSLITFLDLSQDSLREIFTHISTDDKTILKTISKTFYKVKKDDNSP
jgi:hypothetical protein